MTKKEEVLTEVSKFDFHYDFSDDQSVWRKGLARKSQLIQDVHEAGITLQELMVTVSTRCKDLEIQKSWERSYELKKSA